MTEHDDGSGRAATPPSAPEGPAPGLRLELVADLHAGALDAAGTVVAQQLVATDPAGRAVLRALDATVADLATLGSSPVAVPLPAAVAAQLDAALATLGAPRAQPAPDHPAPHIPAPDLPAPLSRPAAPAVPPLPFDLAAARRARLGRRGALGVGVLAVAAAAVGIALLGGLPGVPGTTSGSAVAQPLDLGSGQLGTTVLASLGTSDLGPLRDPAVLAGCLAANSVPAGTPVLGSTQVLLRGERGTLLLLTNGTVGSFTALVVGPGCSAGDPARLAQQRIGAR